MLTLHHFADRHKEWIKIAIYFGADVESASEIVQQMYLKLGEIQIKEGNLKGYDEVRMVFGYAVYVMRMEIDLIEKSHEIFTYLSEKGGSNIKMYLSRIIDYNLNAYREKVNTLEMEITQLEEEKAFGQADDKRRIKQRYEDLINNLSTLVDPNDLGY
jgi:hypothetical protein